MKKAMIAAAFAGVLALTGSASAQNFPTHPVTMVIPFAAGGPQDTIGRIIAQRMTELLGQTVVVENVGGAGGMTGAKRVADAKPDGYTMILGSVGTHAQNQTLYKRPLYNVLTDFTPVAFLAETPIAIITRPDLPANNFKEFIAYAKANQTKMQFGSAGAGSATHLACVVLNSAAIGAINTPSVQERLEKLGATVAKADQQSPEWLGQFVLSEIKKWEGPIKASGVSVD